MDAFFFAQLAAKCFVPARRDVVAGRRPPRALWERFFCLLVPLQFASLDFKQVFCAARLARRRKPNFRRASRHRDSALVPDF